jgi:uncharacterized protein (TIGR02147 family)
VKTNVFANLVQPTPANSFRLLLQAELGRRCTGNPQYSLRAFAKYLGIDHATLSQLLRGKRRLTKRMIVKLGTRLGLPKEALDTYGINEQNVDLPSEQPANLREIQQMAHDTAALISDWYHYAILELTRLEGFQADSRWIARVLAITTDEVNIAVARLARLGMLEMAGRACWIDKSGDTTNSLADFAQVSIQRLASTVRGLMLNALQASVAPCLHNSSTLAMSSKMLAAVHERIARFHQELKALVDPDGVCDEVFQLEISLFPLTNLSQTKESEHGTTGNAVADRGN